MTSLSLGAAVELELLLGGLEATVAHLGRGVDELELDLLGGQLAGLGHESAAQGQHTLLGTGDATLDHKVVVAQDTVVREATHGVDVLDGRVELGGGTVVLRASLAELVDLLVDLSTVMVTVLTGAANGVRNAGRMPRSDTSDLTQTTMGLAGQTGDAPTGNHALVTATTGTADDVDHLVLGEHGVHGHLLLEKLGGEVNLGGGITTVHLDLHDVGLLLLQVLHLADLGVADGADHGAVLADQSKVLLEGALTIGVLESSLGESLLLGLVPVLVEATLHLVGQMLSPHGLQGAQTEGGTDVADQTNHNHGGGLHQGHSLAGLLLVELGAGTVHIAHDVGHASLEGHEGGQMAGLGGVILGEGLHLAARVHGALLGQEAQRAVTGMFELPVRHGASLL
mmetsp:Transcript_26813/g.58434  ORF Transcript_26813/g.58434 Transcript_26813/m.58434 type:complete len:397 (+) Transcript_26813:764-1954(+)